MTIIDLNNKQEYQGKRICLGNFDGFHVGHQALAKSADVLVTFDPHPKEVLTQKTIHRLTTPDELKTYVPNVLLIEFTPTIQRMTADIFLNDVIAQLSPSSITVGYDFRFGVNGQGNIDSLHEWGRNNHCQIIQIEKQQLTPEIAYKSSRIREQLSINPNHAIQLLGHPYLMMGTVVSGDKRGREIGFPTANLNVSANKCIPKFGVYRSHVLINSKQYPSISYIGRKPSFNGQHPSIETHILGGYSADIYGQTIQLHLETFIRDEQRFESQTELIKQINTDIAVCYSPSVLEA
ncbi:MAG: riboflavin biosynthesis protein RibF [Candidatus Marinamargulisbacteria bacterium]